MARVPKDRTGRGRLGRLDMLPDAAQPDLVWLNAELRDGKRPQNELRDVFNVRLAAHGIDPISVGSFSRYSVRKAVQFRDLDENIRMASELVEALGVDSADKMTIALAEMIKGTAVKLLEAEGKNMAARDLMELARAIQAVTGAQKQSAEYRRTLEREFEQKMEAGADRAEVVAREAGVSAETIARLRREFLGVRSS